MLFLERMQGKSPGFESGHGSIVADSNKQIIGPRITRINANKPESFYKILSLLIERSIRVDSRDSRVRKGNYRRLPGLA
jgi:hypothetical protein